MRPSPTPRRALRSAVALAALVASGMLGAVACFGPDRAVWFCLNPATGREDPSIGDDNHFVNGEYDPCHCFDPCGEADTCPILVDAGPLPRGCDAGDGGP